MRALYIDVDSLRPDHLSCYGYPRATSPTLDALSARGVRFEHVYTSDAPCLPSRTALWSGRHGFHTGVVSHGGTAAQPVGEGRSRGERDRFAETSWMAALQRAGFYTASVSPFAQRHAAWHWYAGYHEVLDTGKRGMELADEVADAALGWLGRHAERDGWFLHVNFWDPHTPYRTPERFGNPFADDPPPAWLTEEVRRRHWEGYGPHSAQEPHGWGEDAEVLRRYPRMPLALDSLAAVKRWVDGYDVGIRYADEHIGRLVDALADADVLDETVVMVSADHGENLGELNVWGDHQTADAPTCRVPLIVVWPGHNAPRVDRALHYQFDWAATLTELLGGKVPEGWDGQAFTNAFRAGRAEGRDYLVTSQGAWACQRGVRFDDYLFLHTPHAGYKDLPPMLLFNLQNDPHEQHNLTEQQPKVVERGLALLAKWHHEMALSSHHDTDPLMTVMRENAFIYSRGMLPGYLKRLRQTGREHHAEELEAVYPALLVSQ